MRSHDACNVLVQLNDMSDNAYKDYYHRQMWAVFNISTRCYMHYMSGGRSSSRNSGSEKFSSKFLHVRSHRSSAASHDAHMCSADFSSQIPQCICSYGPLGIRPKDVLQLRTRSFELRVPPARTNILSHMCSRLHHSRLHAVNTLRFVHSTEIPGGVSKASGDFQVRTSPNRRSKILWTFIV